MTEQSNIPGDSEIRSALRSWLLGRHANERESVLLEELGICRGRVRIDLAVVNGSFHGYEIKSDRDSLRRLERQAEIYSQVLDRVTLVVGESHLREALPMVPTWWALLRVEQAPNSELRFRSVRRGRTNPRRDPRALAELLWLDDSISLLEARDAVRGVRGKPRRVVWDRLCDLFEIDEIALAVRARLKARGGTQDSP